MEVGFACYRNTLARRHLPYLDLRTAAHDHELIVRRECQGTIARLEISRRQQFGPLLTGDGVPKANGPVVAIAGDKLAVEGNRGCQGLGPFGEGYRTSYREAANG